MGTVRNQAPRGFVKCRRCKINITPSGKPVCAACLTAMAEKKLKREQKPVPEKHRSPKGTRLCKRCRGEVIPSAKNMCQKCVDEIEENKHLKFLAAITAAEKTVKPTEEYPGPKSGVTWPDWFRVTWRAYRRSAVKQWGIKIQGGANHVRTSN